MAREDGSERDGGENGAPPDSEGPPIRIEIDYDRSVYFALQHNAVPLVKLLRVINDSASALQDCSVSVWIEPELSARWEARIARIEAAATYNFSQVDLPLLPERLINVIERSTATLWASVVHDRVEILREPFPLELLAYNEWSGIDSLPEILASFVLPNHPGVATVLDAARAELRNRTGDPSLDGYQRRSLQRARQITASIYDAVRNLELSYVSPPASFEKSGQKVRTPDAILEHRMGTCLDLVTLIAACLEQAGLNPLIIILEGHAVVGVWLIDRCFPDAASDDPIRLRKRVQLDEICLLEATGAAAAPPMDFEEAARAGARRIENGRDFEFAVDIKAARIARIRPLPARRGGAGYELAEGVEEDAPASDGQGEIAEARCEPVVAPAGDVAIDEAGLPGSDRLETWKRKLLDLSLRNRLLNFVSSKKTIPLLVADLSELEDVLASGRDLAIEPAPDLMGDRDPRSADVHRSRTGEDALAGYLTERLAGGHVAARLEKTDLDRRLLELYRAARLSLEEGGANTLFLALGFLAWYENASSTQRRRAPILLLPLELTRASVRSGFRIRLSEDEVRVNTTLLQKLKHDYGITLQGVGELPQDATGFDVPAILRRFRRAVVEIDRWEVVDEAQIGLFSFTKFLMWRDLDEHAATFLKNPTIQLLLSEERHDGGGDEGFIELADLDTARPVTDILCPLDADASQLSAVFAAEQGTTFVLEGPPGTGKSQTITNLIAQNLAAGKRVLFVSAKMAALNVVYRRLHQVGIGPFCLELHSNKARKKEVVSQLMEALDALDVPPPEGWQAHAEKVEDLRNQLNRYADAIHRRHSLGMSIFEVTSQLIRLRHEPRLELDLENHGAWDRAAFDALGEKLHRIRAIAEQLGNPAEHAWRAVRREDWDQSTVPGIEALLKELRARVSDTTEALRRCAEPLGLSVDRSSRDDLIVLDRVCGLLVSEPLIPAPLVGETDWETFRTAATQWVETGRRRNERYGRLSRDWDVEALRERDPGSLRATFQRNRDSFFLLKWLRLRGPRSLLKDVMRRRRLPKEEELIRHLRETVNMIEDEEAIARVEERARAAFGQYWGGIETDWDRLENLVDRAGRLRAALVEIAGGDGDQIAELRKRWGVLLGQGSEVLGQEGPTGTALMAFSEAFDLFGAAMDLVVESLLVSTELAWGSTADRGHLERVAACVDRWLDRLSELRDWCLFVRTCRAGTEAGLGEIVRALLDGHLPVDRLQHAFDRSFYEWWLNGVIAGSETLKGFHGIDHNEKISRFRELDQALIETTRDLIRARLSEHLPIPSPDAPENSEMGILIREFRKRRRHLPVRRLFQRIPNLLFRLKPCLLMSPLSVAQYLTDAMPAFDLVVFDEASQIPTWDAVGAVARGAGVIVVGDSRQLPPTTFFTTMDDEIFTTEDDIEELESILDECIAAGVPRRYLMWHYRSRHEALITFSNYYYYGNRLLTFPAAVTTADHLGVVWRHMRDAVYDRGTTQTNEAEAAALVDQIVEQLTGPERGDRSIGVVTLNVHQQELVEDLLEEARREHPEIDRSFTDAVPEPVFVKNLENVQGDERDVIMLSVGYGRDANGRISMNFGPLNRIGGERRLNVAITRAREQLFVFSSLRGDDIDLSRTASVGARHLKTFLDYAERGAAAIAEAVGLQNDPDQDFPFETDVSDVLAAEGWEVHKQVGCSGYRVDLAVVDPEDPGRYLIGIECDGVNYNSARTARDRDRLRVAVMQSLGWELHRIWSLDWWVNREAEIARLAKALERARERKRALKQEPEEANREPAGPELTPDSEASEEPDAEPEWLDRTTPLEGQEVYPPVEDPEEPAGTPEEFFESRSLARLVESLEAIVRREGPISAAIARRRLMGAWHVGRLTRKVRQRLDWIVAFCTEAGKVRIEEGFLWRPELASSDYAVFRVPAEDAAWEREIEDIPLAEVANAAEALLKRHGACPVEELARAAARLFGVRRLSGTAKSRVEEAIRYVEARGRCEIRGGIADLHR